MLAIEDIAEGFAGSIVAIRAERSISEALERIGGDRELATVMYDVAYDDEDQPILESPYWYPFTVSGFLRGYSTVWHNGQCEASDFSDIRSLSDFVGLVRDLWECGPVVELPEMERQIAEEKRKKLESVAADFARKCGHKVGTREYVKAAREEIEFVRNQRELWNGPEMRMEQWGRCNGRSEVYYDDLNFVNGNLDSRLDGLADVMQWLEENCPLLMRQMEE